MSVIFWSGTGTIEVGAKLGCERHGRARRAHQLGTVYLQFSALHATCRV